MIGKYQIVTGLMLAFALPACSNSDISSMSDSRICIQAGLMINDQKKLKKMRQEIHLRRLNCQPYIDNVLEQYHFQTRSSVNSLLKINKENKAQALGDSKGEKIKSEKTRLKYICKKLGGNINNNGLCIFEN